MHLTVSLRGNDGNTVKGLSNNEALPWTIVLIQRYENRWDWHLLSANESLPWSLELIERYEKRWNWDGKGYYVEEHMGGLSANKSLPWSLELILRFEKRWNWMFLLSNKSIVWSLEIIEGLIKSSGLNSICTISHPDEDYTCILYDTKLLELAPTWSLLNHAEYQMLKHHISQWLYNEMEKW